MKYEQAVRLHKAWELRIRLHRLHRAYGIEHNKRSNYTELGNCTQKALRLHRACRFSACVFLHPPRSELTSMVLRVAGGGAGGAGTCRSATSFDSMSFGSMASCESDVDDLLPLRLPVTSRRMKETSGHASCTHANPQLQG